MTSVVSSRFYDLLLRKSQSAHVKQLNDDNDNSEWVDFEGASSGVFQGDTRVSVRRPNLRHPIGSNFIGRTSECSLLLNCLFRASVRVRTVADSCGSVTNPRVP